MAELEMADLRPGKRVTLYRLLGRGAWKLTIRGVHVPTMQDVAIKVYLDQRQEKKQLIDELSPLLAARDDYASGKDPFAANICQLVDYFDGADHRFYWAEELIERPLDRVGRVESGELFCRIARDLSRGLAYLHRKGRIHGDLKLENVGLTHGNVAKIFDLGSVTSKPEERSVGNFATKDPAIITANAEYRGASDIWALGATLFALRTGEYPFVLNSELKQRNKLKKYINQGRESPKQKEIFDQSILETVKMRLNEAVLANRVSSTLPGRPGEILLGMLKFNQDDRPTADQLATEWDECLAGYLLNLSPSRSIGDWSAAEEVSLVLKAFLDRSIAITDSQWTHIQEIIKDIEHSAPAAEVKSSSVSTSAALWQLYKDAQSVRLSAK